MILLGGLSLIIWLYLLLGRGGFWRFGVEPVPSGVPAPAPSVDVVIPARDEEETIGRTVRSLLAQDYPGTIRIFVVDDHSSDATAAVARAAGDVAIIPAVPLPAGWTGKLWAVSQGVEAASSAGYFLFTDADIVHSPDSLRSLVARAEAGCYDLVSYMVRLKCETLAERALIPAFVFFFFMLYPPAWIARRDRKIAGAAGGCVLIRPEALKRIGGIASIRNELIDDCALAAQVKKSGGAIWLGLTDSARSLRSYEGFRDVSNMIARTAFTQLDHSLLLLIGTVLGLLVTYVVPLICWNWLGLAAFILMTLAYLPAVRFYKLSPLWALSLPLAAVFYLGATIQSAIRYWSGRGGQWKGRVQDAPTSRALK